MYKHCGFCDARCSEEDHLVQANKINKLDSKKRLEFFRGLKYR